MVRTRGQSRGGARKRVARRVLILLRAAAWAAAAGIQALAVPGGPA